jgi:hypothetical protein
VYPCRRAARILLGGVVAVVEVLEDDRQVAPELGHAAAVAVELGDGRRRGAHRLAAGGRGLAQRRDARARRLGERLEVVEEALDLPGAQREVAQRGTLCVDGLAELGHGRAQLAQEAGQPPEARGDLVVARRRDLRGPACLADEAAEVGAVVGQLADDLVGVRGQIGQDVVLLGEDGEDLVRLAQGRARAAQARVEVLGVARDGGAQLGDDEAQALAVRAGA